MIAQVYRVVEAWRDEGLTLDDLLASVKREWLLAELKQTRGNQCEIAKRAGIHRNTLRRRLNRLGIKITRRRLIDDGR